MVTRPSDLFSRLPSVNELLDKQPVRVLVDRWNRSAVADSLKSFLTELRSDIERRAADFQMPSLREIAERAARHVAAQRQSQLHPVINATGRFFGPECNSLPLADAGLERVISTSRGFLTAADDPSSAASQLRRLTGAEAALVTSSYSGAISIALAALAAGRDVLVAKGDLGELADGPSLAATAQASGVTLREVGSVNHATLAEFETAFHNGTAAILRHDSETYRIQGDCDPIDAAALVGLARRRQTPLVELAGSAPLVADLPWLSAAPRAAAQRIAAGASLVIIRGDGLLGGPCCGILLGSRSLIDRIAAHPLASAWSASPTTLAALEGTLALYEDPASLAFALPLAQLLSTSLENHRQRAERLAPQFAQAADVAATYAVEQSGSLGLANVSRDELPSYAVALTPVDGNVAALDKRLRSAAVPIIGARSDDRLLINLLAVLPRQDQALVEMIAGTPTADATTTESAVSEQNPPASQPADSAAPPGL
jgi:L-seryl-tRNA(Ser) seleniumtransferase